MSSQTPHAGRHDALHLEVQAFADEHRVDLVLASFDGRLVSVGGKLAMETAERFAGTAYGMAVTARWMDHELDWKGLDAIVVRFTHVFWVLSPVHSAGWLAMCSERTQDLARLSHRVARFAELIPPLLPEQNGLLELPSPLSPEALK